MGGNYDFSNFMVQAVITPQAFLLLRDHSFTQVCSQIITDHMMELQKEWNGEELTYNNAVKNVSKKLQRAVTRIQQKAKEHSPHILADIDYKPPGHISINISVDDYAGNAMSTKFH